MLDALNDQNRLLFSVELRPVQGDRFQPTGFPALGAATYQTKDGPKLLVESAQSMANRLEATCWDTANNQPVAALAGISHVTITRKKKFLTDSMLEAHRINSPYLLNSSDRTFLDAFLPKLRTELGEDVVNKNNGLIDRSGLARTLLMFDVGSLLHGVFLSNKVKLSASDAKPESIAGGRLRIARVLSAFIEASGVKVAASGGVRNDHVNSSGDTSAGFGNVIFARDEYVAEKIECHINFDLAQLRGYGLGEKAEKLLILLALYRLRKLLDDDLRLRTSCDLEPVDRENITASRPNGFVLPSLNAIEANLTNAIKDCEALMTHTTSTFEDELKKEKDADKKNASAADEEDFDEDSSDSEESDN